MNISGRKFLTLIIGCVLVIPVTQAQFKKYKSKTKFKGKPTAGQQLQQPSNLPQQKTSTNPQVNLPNDNKETNVKKFLDKETRTNNPNNIFGRGTGVNSVKKGIKDKKYVNLNPETAFGPEVVTSFDFPNITLIDLTKHMQKLTGINLILDKELKGKITILAPSAITVGDAWKAYLTALNLNGYTLVKSGSFYKIVQSRDIRYTPTKIYTGSYTPETENYVMRIIPLKNISSTEVTRSFRPFMSRYGRIIDIKQTNTIIVQDTGSNINRLVRLIKFIDIPGHEEKLQIIPMRYSSAQEIAGLIDKILKGGSSSGSSKAGSKFRSSNGGLGSVIRELIAEPRTNSIIAMANDAGAKQLRALIQKLDVRYATSTGGKIHVYYLQHGDAETLQKTLSALVSGSGPKKTTSSRSSSRFSRRSSSSSDNSLFSSQVKIQADKSNNALVVTAAPTDYLTVKNVISKLDVPREQVYVEGLIMETATANNNAFGISLIGAYGKGNTERAGFKGDGSITDLLTGQIQNLGGLFIGGGLGPTVEIDNPAGGDKVKVKTLNALLTAVATNSNTNILATPQVLAMDNEEAIFEVGEKVPIPKTTNTSNGSSQTSVETQDVTLKLKITPQINKVTRFVKLKLDQKIEDFADSAINSGSQAAGVRTTIRQAVTTVLVRDRDTIAMGGLMRDKSVLTENKVPLLGDIPIVGWLFKNKRKTVEKVNLLFFLTPKILASYEKTMSRNVKDLLNRRSAHMKDVHAEDDPFGTTVKGLYEKAKRQEKGPLYDQEDALRYLRQNQQPGIGKNSGPDFEVPNYKQIVQEVNKKQASRTRK